MSGTPEPKHAAHRETGDLALAAYAHMRGMRVVKAEDSRRGRIMEYRFTIHDLDGIWDEVCIEFANSEAQKHDSSVRTLKRLCKRSASNGR